MPKATDRSARPTSHLRPHFGHLIFPAPPSYHNSGPACPGPTDRETAVKIKVDRIISIATLTALLVAIVLVLKKPAPVAQSSSYDRRRG